MIKGIVYYKSKLTGMSGHINMTSPYTKLGLYISLYTDHYFIPVSFRIREIFNQD
jgi:hypothetical protein